MSSGKCDHFHVETLNIIYCGGRSATSLKSIKNSIIVVFTNDTDRILTKVRDCTNNREDPNPISRNSFEPK